MKPQHLFWRWYTHTAYLVSDSSAMTAQPSIASSSLALRTYAKYMVGIKLSGHNISTINNLPRYYACAREISVRRSSMQAVHGSLLISREP